MRIRDLLSVQSIELGGTPGDKTEVLNHMVDLMAKGGNISDVETYRKGVFAREEEGTTGIGMGIAIPHCKSDAVKAPCAFKETARVVRRRPNIYFLSKAPRWTRMVN